METEADSLQEDRVTAVHQPQPKAQIRPSPSDKVPVSQFLERASQLLDAAESASARGEACSGLTVLIGHDGALSLIAQNDWPLDSLAEDRCSRTAYRVSESSGQLSVEGREGSRRCLLASTNTAATARLLLGR